jgi:coiled-coil domain-containing protein 151
MTREDATGVSDVNEVIQKFLTQDETHNNLVAMTKEAQARIDQLNEEKV